MSDIKTTCFAYAETKGVPKCRALKELYCKNEECKFYRDITEMSYAKIELDIKEYSGSLKKGEI